MNINTIFDETCFSMSSHKAKGQKLFITINTTEYNEDSEVDVSLIDMETETMGWDKEVADKLAIGEIATCEYVGAYLMRVA